MAIDYGLKTFLGFYSRSFIRFLHKLGVLKEVREVNTIGPLELTIQERPLRIDFVILVGQTYIIIEGKSEGAT